ncbi:gamma-glutamyl-gamma-aminobutyrate hydrolase family protein [Sneathiella aquimaris]|uniref:gamma-glutamyl-gamma-aminobutyrate hydrolase family protein n=1 Tax=Sneathiella aquimaris TaxID=2599305 RepID=UPI00146E13F5|nr:gamma-glutamyl-gamma-aminobutyrate hydrolase family protein [Sneathiella aquimaris]
MGVWLVGGQAHRITPEKQERPLDHYSGFIITGGSDVHPELYGDVPLDPTVSYDRERDTLEQKVIGHAIKEKSPILCICRGMQLLNVTLGGTLYQEAKDVLEGFLPSGSLISKAIGRRDVVIQKDAHLFDLLGQYEHYRVNSIHHQAVNKTGDGLRVVALEKNNVVQAIEQVDRGVHPFMIGVQWHPELMLYTQSARNLFRSLVQAARP